MNDVIVFKGRKIPIPEETDIRVLTETEYDALSEEEKANGVFYVPDGSTNESPGFSDGQPSEDVYSTDEQIVGTWVNGKPVYEKTVYTYCANATYTISDLVLISDVLDETVELDGVVYDGDGRMIGIPNVWVVLGVLPSGCFYTYLINEVFINRRVIAKVRYTKTTDEAVM